MAKYVNWGKGEPDNGNLFTDEDCVVKGDRIGDQFGWADFQCKRTDALALCETESTAN